MTDEMSRTCVTCQYLYKCAIKNEAGSTGLGRNFLILVSSLTFWCTRSPASCAVRAARCTVHGDAGLDIVLTALQQVRSCTCSTRTRTRTRSRSRSRSRSRTAQLLLSFAPVLVKVIAISFFLDCTFVRKLSFPLPLFFLLILENNFFRPSFAVRLVGTSVNYVTNYLILLGDFGIA